MLTTHKQQAGVTLVELMVGLLVGMIVIAAGSNIFITSIRGQTDNINLTRLNQDMRTMMDIMARDIRRAGFVTSYPDTPANFALLQNNPFFDATTDGATTDIAIHNSNSCIVYSYNQDEEEDNGTSSPAGIETPPAVDNNERLGFMLDGVLLKMRKSGATNEDCDTGEEWENISEPEVEITGLTFSLDESPPPLNVTAMSDGTGDYNGDGLCDAGEDCNGCDRDGIAPDPACLYVRKVTITLTGRLRDDPDVKQTITEQVRVRNDKFLSAIP